MTRDEVARFLNVAKRELAFLDNEFPVSFALIQGLIQLCERQDKLIRAIEGEMWELRPMAVDGVEGWWTPDKGIKP